MTVNLWVRYFIPTSVIFLRLTTRWAPIVAHGWPEPVWNRDFPPIILRNWSPKISIKKEEISDCYLISLMLTADSHVTSFLDLVCDISLEWVFLYCPRESWDQLGEMFRVSVNAWWALWRQQPALIKSETWNINISWNSDICTDTGSHQLVISRH